MMELRAIPILSDRYITGETNNRWILQEKEIRKTFWGKETVTWKYLGSYDTLSEAKLAAEHKKKEIVYF